MILERIYREMNKLRPDYGSTSDNTAYEDGFLDCAHWMFQGGFWMPPTEKPVTDDNGESEEMLVILTDGKPSYACYRNGEWGIFGMDWKPVDINCWCNPPMKKK